MLTSLVCLLAGGLSVTSPAPWAPEDAHAIVSRAIYALGGRAALEGIASLAIESIGHDYFIDQSERPEGPFIVMYVSTSEQRDVAGGRTRFARQQRFALAPEWSPAGGATIVDKDAAAAVTGERLVPAPRQDYEDGRERLELAPERLLLTALN